MKEREKETWATDRKMREREREINESKVNKVERHKELVSENN